MPASDAAPQVTGPPYGDFQPDIESAAHSMVMQHPGVRRMKSAAMKQLAKGHQKAMARVSKFKLASARTGRVRAGKGA